MGYKYKKNKDGSITIVTTEDEEYAPVKNKDGSVSISGGSEPNQNVRFEDEDVAPARQTATEAPAKKDKKWYDGFLQLGDALSDGYQLGDITKTLLGTDTDIATNAISGVVGWGEDILDAGATLASRATGALGMKDTSEKLRQFAETDQYDAQEVSRKILSSNFMSAALGPLGNAVKTIFTLDDWLNSKEVDNGFGGTTTVREDNSILGDTSDSMIQSAGEIVAKKGLQMATGGFPIADIITGVTVFGNQAEQALKEDATLDEAIGSGLISAGAEIIFEKLSDGINFGNTTLDGKLTKLISDNISKIALRNVVHLFKDISLESLEEVFTEVVSTAGTALYKEEDLLEILGSEEAINSYIQSAITGGLMGGGFSGYKAINAGGKYDYKTGLNNEEKAVVDKVYNDRIAEAEGNGNKLKGKDKAKIYEGVVSDLRKGKLAVTNEVADEPITEEPITEEQVEPQAPEENVFQNEMEKLTEQTKNTIPEEAAVEEKIAEGKQPSSPKDLMDIAKQARRENFHGAYTENGKQYLSDGSFVAEFNTVDESLEQRADFPGKIATQEIAEAFERPAQGNFDIHETEDGYVKVGNSVFDSKYVNAMVRAFDNPKFSIAKHRGGHEVLLVTGDNGRAVLMPVEAGENVNVAYEAQELAPTKYRVYRGYNKSRNANEKNLTPNKSFYDYIGKQNPNDVTELAPLAYYTENDEDARSYADMDKRRLEEYRNAGIAEYRQKVMDGKDVGGQSETEYAEKAAINTFRTLHGGDPNTAGYVESYDYTPHKVLDLTTLGDTTNAYDATKTLSRELGVSESELDNILTLGNFEDNFAVFKLLRNTPSDNLGTRLVELAKKAGYDSIRYKEDGNNHFAIITDGNSENGRLIKADNNTYPEDFAPITEDEANKLSEENLASLTDEDAPAKETPKPKEAYEAIRPEKPKAEPTPEPRMKRVDSTNNAPDGMEERSFIETATGSDAVDGVITPDDIPDAIRYYKVKSNKKTLAAANKIISENSFEDAVKYFENRMKSSKITAEDIALGERLIQEAAKKGDGKTATNLTIDSAILGTEYGQVIQAMSIIRRLSPEGQLRAIVRMIERGKAKGDPAFAPVELTDEFKTELGNTIISVTKEDGTFDQAELNAAVETAKQMVADKMAVTTLEKIDAWRYLSMLGNPKTHLRQIISNVAMFGTRAVKNAVARTIEDVALRNKKPTLNTTAPVKKTTPDSIIPNGTRVKAADRDNIGTIVSYNADTQQYKVHFKNKKGYTATVTLDANTVKPLDPKPVKIKNADGSEDIAPVNYRTKTWERASEAVKAFAKETTKAEKTAITGESKYSNEGSIKAKRRIFDHNIINTPYQKASDALEWEDFVFSNKTYQLTLQEFLTANGVKTEADIKNNPELVEAAKDYALAESRRATFKQDSFFARKIAEIENVPADAKGGKKILHTAVHVAVGSTMPFKKTPINVAKAGLAYSPLGVARNIYDYIQVKKGNMDASEAIDHVAQTFTGSALAMLGFVLADFGILNGAGEDDKESKYDYQLGEQSYSFTFGGDTYSLSWLSPVAMPLFVGANFYEGLVEQKDWDANMVFDTLGKTVDPLSEMSFLSSLDDVLTSYDSGADRIFGMAGSMAQNYATQFIPTLSSQIASTFDDTKRSTKASKDSGFAFGEETLNKMLYKIPGLRNTLEPTTDIWGNEVKQTENFFARGFESFFYPANKRAGIYTAVDEEIKDLYRQTDDVGVIPAIPYNYINYDGEKYEMSASEHTEYKKLYGQTAYDLMSKLFDTNTYKNATSEERADMVNRVYDYARDEAKREYFSKYDVEYTNSTKDGAEVYKENTIKGAIEADMPVEEYTFYKENPGKYRVAKAIGGYDAYKTYSEALNDLEADKDENGKSISGSRKEKVIDYINGLNIDYGQKIILFRSMYDSKDDRNNYNADIVEYLDSRDDISYSEMVTILKELEMTVHSDGRVTWD